MKIQMLMENRAASPQFCCAHGVSMHLETEGLRILFDFGPNDGFVANAEKLGVDLSRVAFAALSHGHYDHGGGLAAFLQKNNHAPVYLSRHAFGKQYAKQEGHYKYIGLDKSLACSKRLQWVEEQMSPAPEVLLFSLPQAAARPFLPEGNRSLYQERDGEMALDTFSHELNLLVREKDKNILLSGCAHSGILGIVHRAEKLAEGKIDIVLGGFHLMSPDSNQPQNSASLKALANALDAYGATYYAFHCTGEGPFAKLKNTLGSRLHTLRAGDELVL